jgi:hypothetical protein
MKHISNHKGATKLITPPITNHTFDKQIKTKKQTWKFYK